MGASAAVTDRPASGRRRGRAAAAPKPDGGEQEPAIAADVDYISTPEPETAITGDAAHLIEPGRTVDGVAIVAAAIDPSNLSAGSDRKVPTGRLVLTLAGGREVFGCVDCPEVVDDRGKMMIHRREHGGKSPGPAKGSAYVPPTVLAMTLGEVLSLGGHIEEWGRLFEKMTEENADLKRRVAAAERDAREARAELDREKTRVRKFMAKQAEMLGMKVVED